MKVEVFIMYDFLRKWKKEKLFKIFINYPDGCGCFEVIDFSPFHRKLQLKPSPDERGPYKTVSIDDFEIKSIDIVIK